MCISKEVVMKKTFVTPEFLHDRVYSYKEDGKIRYQFLMVASTISEFVPVRFPIETVILPTLVKVYIPQTVSRDEMDWRDKHGLYENGVHANQTYVRDDSFDNLKLQKDVFVEYKTLKIVSGSKSPIIIEEGAFDNDAHINFVCPEDFELRVVSHKCPYWKKDNTLGMRERRYAIIGDKKIFDEIEGYMSTLKHQYSFLPAKSMKLPKITVNAHQKVEGSAIVDAPNPVLAKQLKNINNKDFSFSKLLSKDDIVELLKMNNLQLVPQTKDTKPMLGRTGENGKYSIIAICKRIDNSYEKEEQVYETAESATFKNIPTFRDTTKPKDVSIFDQPEIIVIKDYYMSQYARRFMSDKEVGIYATSLTKIYHDFMTEKFGDIYMEKAKEFFDNRNEKSQAEEKDSIHQK